MVYLKRGKSPPPVAAITVETMLRMLSAAAVPATIRVRRIRVVRIGLLLFAA
jgi:hypothetical protein